MWDTQRKLAKSILCSQIREKAFTITETPNHILKHLSQPPQIIDSWTMLKIHIIQIQTTFKAKKVGFFPKILTTFQLSDLTSQWDGTCLIIYLWWEITTICNAKSIKDNREIFQEVFSYDFLGCTKINNMFKSFFNMRQP